MPFEELWSLIQRLVHSGKLDRSDAPHILSNSRYQTSHQSVQRSDREGGFFTGASRFLTVK